MMPLKLCATATRTAFLSAEAACATRFVTCIVTLRTSRNAFCTLGRMPCLAPKYYRRDSPFQKRRCDREATGSVRGGADEQAGCARMVGALPLVLLAALAAALGPSSAWATESATAVDGLSQTFVPGLVGDDPLREGFISAFLLIFFSEIGDKTFFIAVLLALQQSQGAVFTGTFGALAVMTLISVGLGRVFHQLDELLPGSSLPWDDLLAVALLLFFGVQTLQQALAEGDDDEKGEAEEVVATFGSGGSAGLVLSTFALVFAAEWGDKSFLATIALAAASSPAGVVAGAITGHGLATALAVLGGGVLGKYASEKVVQLVGGSLFLLFAAATAFDLVKEANLL